MKSIISVHPTRKRYTIGLAGTLLFVAIPAWSATPTGVAKFFAADGATGDQFGYSVALSGDTAVIGARFDDDDVNGLESGSAYVFIRSGTTWTQQAKLTAPDGEARDWFGVRVAISGDTAVITADADDDDVNGKDTGTDKLTRRLGLALPSITHVAWYVVDSAHLNTVLSLPVALNTHFPARKKLTCQYLREISAAPKCRPIR